MRVWEMDGSGNLYCEEDGHHLALTTPTGILDHINIVERDLADAWETIEGNDSAVKGFRRDNERLLERERQYQAQAEKLVSQNNVLMLALAALTKKGGQRGIIDVLPFSLPAGTGCEILVWHQDGGLVGRYETIEEGHILARVKRDGREDRLPRKYKSGYIPLAEQGSVADEHGDDAAKLL